MYDQDSFFTLTLTGRVGVACLSGLMTAMVVYLCWKLTRRHRSVIWRTAVAFLLYATFIWLAPQVYYTYYIFLLEDIPWQVVVQAPPLPGYLLDLMLFRETANLSFHAQGVLGWLLLATGLIAPKIQAWCLR